MSEKEMNVDLTQTAIDTYVNLMRIKAEETATNKELDCPAVLHFANSI